MLVYQRVSSPLSLDTDWEFSIATSQICRGNSWASNPAMCIPQTWQPKSQPKPQDTSMCQLGSYSDSKQPIVEPSKHTRRSPKFSRWPGQSRFSIPVGTLSRRLRDQQDTLRKNCLPSHPVASCSISQWNA